MSDKNDGMKHYRKAAPIKKVVLQEAEESCIKGLALGGHGALPAVVDTKGGKIIRIRPLHLDWKYDQEEFNPWRIEVRGRIFDPSLKISQPPFNLAYKKRVYSPNRIRYPLKRVDWDLDGKRNPQNRGRSKFKRISWDEATNVIAREIKRVIAKYGSYAILAQGDGHGESKIVHAAHGCQYELLKLLGGSTFQQRSPDSWEGWYWGAKHVWGMDATMGHMAPQTNLVKDVSENSKMLLFGGCDPETTPYFYLAGCRADFVTSGQSLYIAGKVYSSWKKTEIPEDIRVESLRDDQLRDLNRLKKWIYQQRTRIRLKLDRADRQEREEASVSEREELQPALFEF